MRPYHQLVSRWFGEHEHTKQPISSPFASLGRYFSFCSSLPNSLIGCITTVTCQLHSLIKRGDAYTKIEHSLPIGIQNRPFSSATVIPRRNLDSPLDFSRNQTIRDTAHTSAAVAFDRRSKKSELSHLSQDLRVKVLLHLSVGLRADYRTFRYASRTRGCSLD